MTSCTPTRNATSSVGCPPCRGRSKCTPVRRRYVHCSHLQRGVATQIVLDGLDAVTCVCPSPACLRIVFSNLLDSHRSGIAREGYLSSSRRRSGAAQAASLHLCHERGPRGRCEVAEAAEHLHWSPRLYLLLCTSLSPPSNHCHLLQ